MRIGVYDPYLDDLGGGEKYMMTIASCLSKQHHVTVFWDHKEDIQKLQQRFAIDFSRVTFAPNIFTPKISHLRRALVTKKYDAIIVLSDGSIPFSLSKKLFVHFQAPLQGVYKQTVKNKVKLSRVNAIFCNSYFTKSYIDKEFNVNSIVLYPPVDLSPRLEEKENFILHVGRFRAKNVKVGDYKKQGFMVEIFKKMVKEKKNGNWRFVIAVGVRDTEKELFDSLRKQAKGVPIEFLVNLNNEELLIVYAKAKIYWHASGFGEDLERHPEFAEHFGISTVEAMGAGAVPVVINAGGQKEIVENNMSGFLWNASEELIEKTQSLMKDENLLKKLSYEAMQRAKEFGGDRFCKEVEKIIMT